MLSLKTAWAALFLFLFTAAPSAHGQTQTADPDISSLDKLAGDFWAWRVTYAPFNSDDVPRVERPAGTRDWSLAKIDNRRKDLNAF